MIRFANFARLGVALTLTASIGAQIPTRSGTALAADGCCQTTGVGCGGSSNNGGKIFGVKGETIAAGAGVFILIAALTKKTHDLPKDFTPSFGFGSPTPSPSPVPPPIPESDASPEASVAAGSLASSNSLLDVTSPGVRGLLEKCPELAKQLQNDGPYTLFLPSDEALASVKLDGAKLESFLKRHIVIGRYSYDDLTQLSEGATLQTLAETKLAVTHADGNVQIGGITVPSLAQVGNNGFQFVIEGILP